MKGWFYNYHWLYAASSPLWESHIPTRKRTSMSRVPCSSIEKLSKQFQQTLGDFPAAASSSVMHGFSDDILVDSKPSTMADEIGLGSVFIRQPMPVPMPVVEEPKSESCLLMSHSAAHGPLQQQLLLTGAERMPSVRGKEKAKECKKVDVGARGHCDQHLNANIALL